MGPRIEPEMAHDSPQEPPTDRLEELLTELKHVYDSEVGEYRRCLSIVAEDLRHVLAQESIRHLPIVSRVKSWASINGAARRRQKDRLTAQTIQSKMMERNENWERHFEEYKMSKTELGYFRNRDELNHVFHDMLGARILLYFPSDTKKVLSLLQDAGYETAREPKRRGGLADTKRLWKLHAKWLDASACKAPTDDLDLDGLEQQFSGYGAIHLAAKVPKRLRPRDLGGPEADIWERRVVEIQVGTIVMHAWAEVEHDITYKTHGREVTQDEKGVLDMLNGLALASEVGLRRFRSPPSSSPSPPAESVEELRSWLYQLYIRKKRSTPAEWADVDQLWDFLVRSGRNRRDEFQPLAEAAWSILLEVERGVGLELDHVLPYIIMHGHLPGVAAAEDAREPIGSTDSPCPNDGKGIIATLHSAANTFGKVILQGRLQDSQLDPHAKDNNGRKGAWYAATCLKNLVGITGLLAVKSRVDPRRAAQLAIAPPDELRQAFFDAVKKGDLDVVQFIIDIGGNVDWKSGGLTRCWSKYNAPALHIANYYSNKDLCRLLVINGANTGAKDAYGNLMTAATWGGPKGYV
ncbi:hypothetical protein B0I37DRAFT_39525 [Chaetomium sp. MPI-CAGE-AT-0009]|nr:hypothetical protein B0I37DRAFT_39525 [Chaetomium sp. MPI-CAGE-AT-0009]